MDLVGANKALRYSDPETILNWALDNASTPIASTSFGKHSAALLGLISESAPELPVVWVDHGYNVTPTYQHVEQLLSLLNLNLKVYSPVVTSERRQAVSGGVPLASEREKFDVFVRDVKLEPFERALSDLKPDLWLTGIRKGETAHRQGLDILSYDGRGILKVAPFFYFSDGEMLDYIHGKKLPVPEHYFDPTKLTPNSECGLHTARAS